MKIKLTKSEFKSLVRNAPEVIDMSSDIVIVSKSGKKKHILRKNWRDRYNSYFDFQESDAFHL